MIDVSNIMLSDKVSCNNRKDWWDIVSYQVDKAAIITLFIKKPINMFSYSVFQYDKKVAYTMLFNVLEAQEWVLQCQ